MKHNYMLISILVVVVFFSISVHSIGLVTEHYGDAKRFEQNVPMQFDVSGSYDGSCRDCSVYYNASNKKAYLKCTCKDARGREVQSSLPIGISQVPFSISGVNNINGNLQQ